MEVKHIVQYGVPVPEEALAKSGELSLNVSEFFFDTIQGEGLNVGCPAAFLRLAGCPVDCKFCDTAAVWKTSQKVRIKWLIDQMKKTGLAKKLNESNMILVITGGSPLLQQKSLTDFFKTYETIFQHKPYVEVENECSFIPESEIMRYVSWWNNSPKLSNAEVPVERRYKPEVLKIMSKLGNCIWKFVVRDEQDIEEIRRDFLKPFNIPAFRVCLMPMGANQEEYFSNRENVVRLAIENGFRYSPREHIAIWDKKTGI